MFNFKYNFLAFLQVFVNFIIYLLLIKFFGASGNSDAYFIVISIVGALFLLQMLTIEQFLYFYNDIKSKCINDAHHFFYSVLGVAILTGIIGYLLAILFSQFLLLLFVGNIDSERFLLIKFLYQIACIELLFYPIVQLNQKLLNAEMKFAYPYLLNLLPLLFIVVVLLIMLYSKTYTIEYLLYAKIVGVLFTVPLSFYMILKINIPIRLMWRHHIILKFVKKSFSMRLGHNIHNFLFTPITTNFLSILPIGYASYFYYAQKLGNIINGVVIGPIYKVFQSRFSQNWSINNISNAKKMISIYLRISVPLFIIFSIGMYIFLTDVFMLLNVNIHLDGLTVIQNIFLGLMIWQLIILSESGYVSILIAEHKSHIFIIFNLIFIISYFTLTTYLFDEYGVYSLCISLIISQILNFLFFKIKSKKILLKKEKNES